MNESEERKSGGNKDTIRSYQCRHFTGKIDSVHYTAMQKQHKEDGAG